MRGQKETEIKTAARLLFFVKEAPAKEKAPRLDVRMERIVGCFEQRVRSCEVHGVVLCRVLASGAPSGRVCHHPRGRVTTGTPRVSQSSSSPLRVARFCSGRGFRMRHTRRSKRGKSLAHGACTPRWCARTARTEARLRTRTHLLAQIGGRRNCCPWGWSSRTTGGLQPQGAMPMPAAVMPPAPFRSITPWQAFFSTRVPLYSRRHLRGPTR